MQLDDYHEADLDAFWQVYHDGAIRLLEHNGTEAQAEVG